MSESSPCLSSFALLRFALHPEEGAGEHIKEHVAMCAICQSRVAEYQAQGTSFMASAEAQATRERLQALEGRSASQGARQLWAWGGALAAAASLMLVLHGTSREGGPGTSVVGDVPLPGPSSPSLTPKGAAQLALWVGDEQAAPVELSEGATLRPGERVQPAFASPKSGFVALLLTTPKGEVIRLLPEAGDQGAALQAGPPAALGPSFRLDEEVGRYRVTAYFSESNFSTLELSGPPPRGEARPFPGVVSERRFQVQP